MNSTANSAAQASYEKGIKHYNEDDFDTAIAEFTKAIGLNLSYTDAYIWRGMAYYSIAYYMKGQYETAIEDCTEAIELDPDNVWAYLCRGWAYEKLGQSDQAIKDYETVLSLDSKNTDAKKALREIRKN